MAVRVHELAKEFGVPSKVILSTLSDMGEYVKSASSTVEAPVIRRLKEEHGDALTKLGAKSAPAKKAPAIPRRSPTLPRKSRRSRPPLPKPLPPRRRPKSRSSSSRAAAAEEPPAPEAPTAPAPLPQAQRWAGRVQGQVARARATTRSHPARACSRTVHRVHRPSTTAPRPRHIAAARASLAPIRR